MAVIFTIPAEDEKFVKDITLDFNEEFMTNDAIPIPQYDTNTRYIRATLLANGQPYVATSTQIITFSAKKPDGFGIDNPAMIDSSGRIIYEVTEQTTNSYGTFDARFDIYDTKTVNGVTITRRKSAFNFRIYISKAPIQDDTIISTNEFKILTDLIATVGDVVNDVNIAIGNANSAATSANTAATNANNAASNANTKASLANSAATSANTAATNANNAVGSVNTAINNANDAADRANMYADEFENILDQNFGINDNVVSLLTAWSSSKITAVYNTLYEAIGIMPIDGGTFFENYVSWEQDGGTF